MSKPLNVHFSLSFSHLFDLLTYFLLFFEVLLTCFLVVVGVLAQVWSHEVMEEDWDSFFDAGDLRPWNFENGILFFDVSVVWLLFVLICEVFWVVIWHLDEHGLVVSNKLLCNQFQSWNLLIDTQLHDQQSLSARFLDAFNEI